MTELRIPCPSCGKRLRVRDPSLLGKRVQCPKCSTPFQLQLTAEVPANEPVASAGPASESVLPDRQPDAFDFAESENLEARRLERLKQKSRKQQRIALFLVAMAALILVGIFVAQKLWFGETASPAAVAARGGATPHSPASSDGQALPTSDAGNSDQATARVPSGPIDLRLIPSGARIFVHIRLSEFWQLDGVPQEVRRCLGPLGDWLTEHLKTICHISPEHIEEALIALYLGPVGTPTEVAGVFRLHGQSDRESLIRELGGQSGPDSLFTVGDWACYLADDQKTLAVCPRGRADDMLAARNSPGLTTQGIEQLLPHTNRGQHIAVLFEAQDVRRRLDALVTDEQMDLANLALEWLIGEDVESVCMSATLDERFDCELLLRNRNVTPVIQLRSDCERKLNELPDQILHAVQATRPQSLGQQRIVGRFPAMTKAFAMSTHVDSEPRHAIVHTNLPGRAGPNLAVGSVSTWEEWRRNGASSSGTRASQPLAGFNMPARIADRLAMKIDVDYRRTPLQEAFEYIGDATSTRFEVDGPSLKLAGYTKNMPQSIKMDDVPATEVLRAILGQYNEMVIVVDDDAKTVTVLTREAARNSGREPFSLDP